MSDEKQYFEKFQTNINDAEQKYFDTFKLAMIDSLKELKSLIKSVDIKDMKITFDQQSNDEGGSDNYIDDFYLLIDSNKINQLTETHGENYLHSGNFYSQVSYQDDNICQLNMGTEDDFDFDENTDKNEIPTIQKIFTLEELSILYDFRYDFLYNNCDDLVRFETYYGILITDENITAIDIL